LSFRTLIDVIFAGEQKVAIHRAATAWNLKRNNILSQWSRPQHRQLNSIACCKRRFSCSVRPYIGLYGAPI